MNTDLDTLKQKRLKWVESNKENGFDEGINRLLTELYPDNAHFIYELLQNAEDPGATHVSFTLSETSVEFEHNGKRLFELKDVESITSIGNSTKREDHTSIGKFGVGFKAVFAYTNTPEIHSGDFHFRIHDLVVPETQGVSREPSNEQKTRFIFPFDHPKKSPETAVAEIQKGLSDLGDNTLLFLSHIRKIEYLLPDGSFGSLERLEHSDGQIEIRARHSGGKDTVSHWLRFHKNIQVADDDGTQKSCRIAIAYHLTEEENKKGETVWKIVPLDHGQVSIYFPAEKEASSLKLHLHAPFASTVARDSVRDCNANRQLRDGIAELIVESLVKIRDQGLLTVSFLAVLPNPVDNLASFYEPIRKAVVQAFKNDKLTPTRSGTHAPATALYRGPARIAEVLGDDDLSFLTNCEPPLWAANPQQQNQREDRFLENLEIDTWSWTELTDVLNCYTIIINDKNESDIDEYESEEDQQRRLIENWLRKKDDSWLQRFYALLGEASEIYEDYVDASDLRIVRVAIDQSDEHVIPSEAYFPPEDDTNPPNDIRFVKPSTYSSGRSERLKNYAKKFLENSGVRTLDAEALIDKKLDLYNNSGNSINNSYIKDLKEFISYWKKNPDGINKFRSRYILLDSEKQWRKPSELCLDAPYIDTGLANFKNIHGKSAIWDGYQEKFTDKYTKIFIDFTSALKVTDSLEIIEAPLYDNPKYNWNNELSKCCSKYNGARESQSTCIRKDYSIPKLDQYLKNKAVSCSLLVWNALVKAEAKAAKAVYRINSNYSRYEVDSQIVYHLKNNAWIPNKKGDFCKPQEMSRDDLRNDFPYDDRNGLLTAIGFGENARKRSEEYQAHNKKAVEMGFESAEQAAKFAELARLGISPDDLLAQQKRAELPEESVPNPERRQKGILERGENAPPKESVTHERSIQPGIEKTVAEAKAYLRAKYTNANREMVCQCCQKEMPFKIHEAYYFEAVQCVNNMDKHHLENRLALCPTCAAMYLHARATDDVDVRRLVIDHGTPDDASSVEIPVTLADQSRKLRFVGTHWFDLKTVLKNG